MIRRIVLVGLVGVVCGCGDNDHPAKVLLDVSADPPAYGTTPFPTDALRDGTNLGLITGLDRIVGERSDLLAAHLAALDGWGLRPTVEFFVQGEIDPDTVPSQTTALTDALLVLDVDPTTPEHDSPVAWDWKYDAARHAIVGAPSAGTFLKEGVRYAAVLTSDVRSADGSPIYGDQELLDLGDHPPDRWATTGFALQSLRENPAIADRIASLTVFTTQTASDTLIAARNDMADPTHVAPADVTFGDPSIVFDSPGELDTLLGQATRDTSGNRTGLEQWGSDNPTGIAHDHVAAVATGTMKIARYRGDDTGTDGPDDETFTIGNFGIPVLQSLDAIPVTFVLPVGPVPATGFPVIVFAHDLGGSRHDMLAIAEPLAAKGYAMIAIDLWGHGSRNDPTDVHNNAATSAGFTGDPSLPDGFGDSPSATPLAFFEGFTNLAAIRDSMRQSALDFTRVASLVQTRPDLSAVAAAYGGTAPTLDPTRVAFLGQGFGASIGTMVAASEPSIGMYVLNAPGGGVLDEILPNSAVLGESALQVIEAAYSPVVLPIDRFNPLVGVLQAVFDGGDPLTYSRHVFEGRLEVAGNTLDVRNVLAVQPVTNEVMPEVATEQLARGLELGVLQPALGTPKGMTSVSAPATANVLGQTGVIVQYEPATHVANWSAQHGSLVYFPGFPAAGADPFPKLPAPIIVAEPIYGTWQQITDTLATFFAGRVPTVDSTVPPVGDFDDDGNPDATDPFPFDPTR